jgi:hypothetical protein
MIAAGRPYMFSFADLLDEDGSRRKEGARTCARYAFNIRRQKHRNAFKRKNGVPPKAQSVDDYVVIDFLYEVRGDQIREGTLTPSVLLREDKLLYQAIQDHLRGLRRGTYDRISEYLSIADILSGKVPAYRKPWPLR